MKNKLHSISKCGSFYVINIFKYRLLRQSLGLCHTFISIQMSFICVYYASVGRHCEYIVSVLLLWWIYRMSLRDVLVKHALPMTM